MGPGAPDVILMEDVVLPTPTAAGGSLCVPMDAINASNAAAAIVHPPSRTIRRKRSSQPVHFSADEDGDEWTELDPMQKAKGRKIGRGLKPGNGLDLSRMALVKSRVVGTIADVQWETVAGGWEQPVCGVAYVSHRWARWMGSSRQSYPVTFSYILSPEYIHTNFPVMDLVVQVVCLILDRVSVHNDCEYHRAPLAPLENLMCCAALTLILQVHRFVASFLDLSVARSTTCLSR